MFGQNTCIFEKFATCKKGENCNYEHPTLVCDDKYCNVQMCLKRHPNVCLYYTIFKECKNGDSCRFEHKKTDVSNHVSEDKYRDLEDKFNALYEDYKIMVKRIESLENIKIQSLRSRSLTDVNKILTRSKSQVEMKRKIEIDCDETSMKKNKLETESMETEVTSDEVMNKDESYCVGYDPIFEEVLQSEYKFAKDLDKDVVDVRTNMKCRKIEETMTKLRSLKEKVNNKRNEMKSVKKHPTLEMNCEDTYEMMNNFEIIVNKLQNLAKNKFKKGAEKELNILHEEIEDVWRQKESDLIGYFHGPNETK